MKMILNKKAEGEVTKMVIGFVLISLFSVSVLGFMVSLDDTYDLGFDESELESFNTITQIQGNFSTPSMSNVDEGSGEIDPQGDVIEGQARAGFKNIKLIVNLPNIAWDVVVDGFRILRTYLPVPQEYSGAIIVIIGVITASSLIALILKVKP